MPAQSTATMIPEGTRGPGDDFYCHKYRVWYRAADCVFRQRNETFTGCLNCFQGHLNIRSLDRGVAPSPFLGANLPDRSGPALPGELLQIRPSR